jgi:hypothetical protein
MTTATPIPRPAAATSNLILRFLPSLTDLAFLLPIFGLLAVFTGARRLLSDCDTGWHIRTGDWILQHRALPYKDLFSFSKPDDAWFAWEWGWDVLASLIHSRWSLSGIAVANALLLGAIGTLLYRLVRRHAGNDVLAFVVSALAILASSLHWLARPHLLSWVFVLAFLHLIDRAEAGNLRLLWCSPPLMLLWVNLHGSFFIGIFLLLTYGLFGSAQRRVTYLLCALACMGASLMNPYGWHLHEHVFRYLTDPKQLEGVSEYASMRLHTIWAVVFELFLVLGSVAAYRCFRAKHWAQALMILVWAHFALKSGRNIPIFLFIAAAPTASLLRDLLGKATAFGQEFHAIERVERLPLVPAIALAFLGSAVHVSDFDKRDFPVAAASVIAHYPDARIFTFDQWGDYLIYRFFPQKRVFVDGRSDFYGADFGDKWVNAINATHDWRTELSRFSINTVLLQTDQPLASVLKESPEWKPVFDDGTAIVFRRGGL